MKNIWGRDARTGAVYKFKKLTYYACEGLIVIHDSSDKAEAEDDVYNVVTPDVFLERVDSLRQGLVGATKWAAANKDEFRLVSRFIREASDAVREAKYMGDPSDPLVQAFWARQRGRAAITVREKFDTAGYPSLPSLPLGRFTGRTAEAGDKLGLASASSADIVQQAGAVLIRKPPVKKAVERKSLL